MEFIQQGLDFDWKEKRGLSVIDQTRISIPTSGGRVLAYYQKMKERKKFRKRAIIEPVIGHL